MIHRVPKIVQLGLIIAKRILSPRLSTTLVLLLFALTACQQAVDPDPPPPETVAPRVIKPIEDVALTLASPSAIKTIDVATNFDDPDAKEGDLLTFTAKSSDVAIVTVSVDGSKITVTAVALGNADVTVTVTDKDRLTAADTFKVTVNPAPTPGPTEQAPVAVGSISAITMTVGAAPATMDVAGYFNDPDGQTLTYSARSDAPTTATALAAGSMVTVFAVAQGTATITVTATDADNLTATQTFSVTVNPAPTPGPTEQAPVAVGSISAITMTVGAAPATMDVAGYFNDPDGQTLTYSARSDAPTTATALAAGSMVTVFAVAQGTATITVTATDADNLTATQTFSVTVNPAPTPGPTEQAPVAVGSISAITMTVGAAPATMDVAGYFNDPDGQTLTYSARSDAPTIATALAAGSMVTVFAVAQGTATITVTATDADNLTATQTFSVTVNPALPPPNRAPVAQGTVSVPELTAGAAAHQVDVASHFTDPDGDALTYKASSSATSVATVRVAGSALTITPVGQGTATITVTVTDPAGETAMLSFSVRVNSAPPPRLTLPYTDVLNPSGRALTNELYELELGASAAEVFVISTNTTTRPVAPNIVRLDFGRQAEQISQPRPSVSLPGPEPAWLRELQLPPLQRSNALPGRKQRLAQVQSPVAVGDRDVFIEHRDHGVRVPVPATVRKVIRTGGTTLAVWVADREWSATCVVIGQCLNQGMVDALATRFLRPGANNDIYDWVTTIFGAPWGPHRYSNLIPPAAADQIHILLLDIEGDGAGNTFGYFFSLHNTLRDPAHAQSRYSAERLIFFMDSAILSIPEGATWDITDPDPSVVVRGLAHEFQHMIHYYQKLIRNDLPTLPSSEAWLNEMASLVAEELFADKLRIPGPRGVASNDPTAGAARNTEGRLPLYNVYNDIQVTAWLGELPDYSINYALGAYLARTYGAELFRKIVQNDQAGVDAIEAALTSEGHSDSFADVLTNWAIANLLSDDDSAPRPYRYNSGTWFTSAVGGQTFRLGSINLFNYRYEGRETTRPLNGPYLFSLAQFNVEPAQQPHSNRYVDIGRTSGTVQLRINAPSGNRITVVVKE